jgi:uncharacterized membrane protein YtjA (UPF0391 family)
VRYDGVGQWESVALTALALARFSLPLHFPTLYNHPQSLMRTVQNVPIIEEKVMLHYAIVFLVIAIIAAIFGFTGIAGTSAWIAHVLFVVFLVLFVISLIFKGRPSV